MQADSSRRAEHALVLGKRMLQMPGQGRAGPRCADRASGLEDQRVGLHPRCSRTGTLHHINARLWRRTWPSASRLRITSAECSDAARIASYIRRSGLRCAGCCVISRLIGSARICSMLRRPMSGHGPSRPRVPAVEAQQHLAHPVHLMRRRTDQLLLDGRQRGIVTHADESMRCCSTAIWFDVAHRPTYCRYSRCSTADTRLADLHASPCRAAGTGSAAPATMAMGELRVQAGSRLADEQHHAAPAPPAASPGRGPAAVSAPATGRSRRRMDEPADQGPERPQQPISSSSLAGLVEDAVGPELGAAPAHPGVA